MSQRAATAAVMKSDRAAVVDLEDKTAGTTRGKTRRYFSRDGEKEKKKKWNVRPSDLSHSAKFKINAYVIRGSYGRRRSDVANNFAADYAARTRSPPGLLAVKCDFAADPRRKSASPSRNNNNDSVK